MCLKKLKKGHGWGRFQPVSGGSLGDSATTRILNNLGNFIIQKQDRNLSALSLQNT